MNNRHIIACALNQYGEEIEIKDDSTTELIELKRELSIVSFWISINASEVIEQGISKILCYCEKLASHDKDLIEKVERVVKIYRYENRPVDKEAQYQKNLETMRKFKEQSEIFWKNCG